MMEGVFFFLFATTYFLFFMSCICQLVLKEKDQLVYRG